MKKTVLAVLLSLCFAFLISCSGSEKAVTSENKKEETDTKAIELQGFTVIIPEGFEGTGGHDGVRYINAIITPKDKNQKYEIEVGAVIAATSNDYQGQMSVRGSYNNTVVIPVDTEGWKSQGFAYTFVRTDDRDFSALTKFNASTGPSQVMGLYRDGQWLEVELRAKEGTISDYPDALYDFMSVAIDWQK